jgi:hypothetical protein
MTKGTLMFSAGLLGLAVPALVLLGLAFGATGVLTLRGGTNLVPILWPFSLMLIGGWHSKGIEALLAAISVALNCATYIGVALGVRLGVRAMQRWVRR